MSPRRFRLETLLREQFDNVTEITNVRFAEPRDGSFRIHLISGRSFVIPGVAGYAFDGGTAFFWGDQD
jgi:hypothetical protein